MKRLIFAVLLTLLAILSPSSALSTTNQSHVDVAVVGSVPFVVNTNGQISGLSVDLWKEVAEERGLSYTLHHDGESVDDVLHGLTTGKYDVVVGPVSITSSRNDNVLFTQPYFRAGISIVAPAESSPWTKLKPFFTKTFIGGTGILLLVLTVVGLLIWLSERRDNDHFPKHPLHGIASGMWFALVTMTTVGYGDKAPKSIVGRLITGMWMVISLVTVSSLTAFIATTLTVAQLETSSIENISQLRDKRVAVIGGTTSYDFVKRNECKPIRVPTPQEGIQLLKAGKVAAFVHDRPVLSYMLDRQNEGTLSLSPVTYEVQGYGFAVADPEMQRTLSTSILRFAENKKIIDIEEKWLGAKD